MKTSKHASIRMQQRGIPRHVVESILLYGSKRRISGGAVARYIPKKAFRHLAQSVPRSEYQALSQSKNVYLVVSNDVIITAGHRTRKFRN